MLHLASSPHRLFLLGMFFIGWNSPNILLSQSEICPMPDRTLAENIALLQGVVPANAQVAGSATWNIPIWLNYVRKSNGYSTWNGDFAPHKLVDDLNQYFNNGFHFYLCGLTYIDSDDWYNLKRTTDANGPSEVPAIQSYAYTHNPEYPKGYIDVFITGTISDATGYAYQPQSGYR